MPKVLIVSTIELTIRSFLLPVAAMLRSEGWEVHAAAAEVTSSRAVLAEFGQAFDLTWSRSPRDLTQILHAASQLRRLCRQERYDIVHFHTPIAAFFGRAALRDLRSNAGLKVIYTAHGFHFYDGQPWASRAVYTAAERIAGRWTDYLVTMNEEDNVAANRLGLVPPERIVYIPGVGIDPDYYSRSAVSDDDIRSFVARLGAAPSPPVLVTIGELNANKRPLEMIQAFARVPPELGAHLAMVGSGPLEADCVLLIDDLGLQGRVHLMGEVEDVRPLIACACALVQFSLREGLPRAVMEALSMQVPVIASDIRGHRDLLRAGAGWLVARDSIPELADAMATAVKLPEEAHSKGLVGRSEVIQRCTLSHILELHRELYGRVVSEGAA